MSDSVSRASSTQIAAEFAELEPRERLELLLEFAEKLAPLPPQHRGRARRGPEPRARVPDAGLSVGRRSKTARCTSMPTSRPRRRRSRDLSACWSIFSRAHARAKCWRSSRISCIALGLAEALGMVRMRGLQAIAHHIRQKVAQAAAYAHE